MIWIWLLLALVPTTIVATAVVLCLPYWRSPEKRWRDGVLRSYKAAQRQVDDEYTELQRLSNRRRDEHNSLYQEAFERFLASISITDLEAYPGIGPATIGRLKQAGYKSLASLQNAQIRIHGLGQKRLDDVNVAVRQLTGNAESRFRAGACPDSHQLAARLKEVDVRYAELDCRATARARGAADVVRQLEPFVAVARQITFWNYFWSEAPDVVPPELLQRALPDLRTAVATAEQQALEAFRGHEASGNSPAQSKSRADVPVPQAFPVNAVPVARPVASAKPPAAPPPLPERMKTEGAAGLRAADRRPSGLQTAATPTANRCPQPGPATDSAQELLEATIEFAFAIARTDGSISRKEKLFIDEQLRQRYGYDPALYNHSRAWCAHYETAAIDIERCLQRIKEQFTPAHRSKLLEFACLIAQASGPLNQREVRLLERAARKWGLPWKPPAVAPVATPQPTKPASAPTAAVSPESPEIAARALLEIDPSAPLTVDLIRRQYNLLSSRLAPEKLEAMGAEFVALAHTKRQALRAAAEALIRPLGAPLDVPSQPTEPADLRHNPDLDAMFGA